MPEWTNKFYDMVGGWGPLGDPYFYRDMVRNVPDVVRGLGAQTLGAPVDLMTMAMKPFGYRVPSDQVVGSTDYIGQKLGANVRGLPFQISSMLPTDASDLMRYGGLVAAAPTILSKMGKIDDAADMARTVNKAGDYQGLHTPPMRDSGAPAFDLTGGGKVYPDDVYGPNAAQYYGHYGQNHPMDVQTTSIVRSLRNRPNADITIYRAVPYEKTKTEKVAELEKQMAAYMRRGVTPDGTTGSGWYNKSYEDLAKLKQMPETPAKKVDINSGDWVTVNRQYAKEHGESTLDGNYKIISKKVKAKDIFTNGDSIHEWGYDPTP